MDDIPDPSNEPHPDALIRLCSAIHRFRTPEMTNAEKLKFEQSFKSASKAHPETVAVMKKADTSRSALAQALVNNRKSTVSHDQVISAAKNYLPLIHQILLTCKVQPEVARLDEKLVFEWSSGIEHAKKYFKSEALMYDLVLTIGTLSMATAGLGCDECVSGDFASASRQFKAAAGMMQHLAEDQLPKWISRGSNVEDKNMPSEASVGVTDAFHTLFVAVAQQMAVTTVLVKPGVPNYGLLAKLTLGVAELLDTFVSTMRSKAALNKSRIDPNFFTLITLQVNMQRALSNYFLARSTWSNHEYGVAIAMLHEATLGMRTRPTVTSKGLPEFDPKTPLKAIEKDVHDFRKHLQTLLSAWENDNSKVYFDAVPRSVPEEKKLKEGIKMIKPDPFELEAPEPLPLSLPGSGGGGGADLPPATAPPALGRSDSDLARELQAKLNSEG